MYIAGYGTKQDVSNQLISEHAYYVELLKERMCEICMRLNKLEDYKKVYEDVYSWLWMFRTN